MRNLARHLRFKNKNGNVGSENTVESIINRLDQAEERLSGIEDSVE
jgi:hypothetical protein